MATILQQILPYASVIVWIGGAIVLFFRARVTQRAYLAQFPPVDGFPLNAPLDRFMGINPVGAIARAMWRAAWQRQSNPELERLRRKAWRRTCAYVLWIFGFPVLVVGVAASLIATGIVRPV